MSRWTFTSRRRIATSFCDRCSQVCDAGCRGRAARDAHRDRGLYLVGMR